MRPRRLIPAFLAAVVMVTLTPSPSVIADGEAEAVTLGVSGGRISRRPMVPFVALRLKDP